MDGLLYPGCLVDVLWCFNGKIARDNPMSKIVLENIPVLAIGKQTVLTPEENLASNLTHPASVRKGNLVTLLLDAKQAEILQLARDQGSIALVMRNPTDIDAAAPRLLSLSSLAREYLPGAVGADGSQGFLAALRDFGQAVNEQLSKSRPAVAAEAPTAGHEWETIIIRGQKLEKARFIVSTADGQM